MLALSLTFRPETALLPAVLSAVRHYAEQCFDSRRDVERVALATEEAINNVLSFSFTSHLESITVTADCTGGEFTVCVYDKGLPGDYEQTLTGEDRLGLTLMHNAVDVVTMENLGMAGRCQKLVKYCSRIPEMAAAAEKEIRIVENPEITVRTPHREEIVEIGRLLYGEYGMTYPNDIVYYPDRFYAAVTEDRIHSTVAVDQYGNVAGHHAVFQWTDIPGVWEGGMAVVSGAYRNAGIFGKMMARSNAYAEEIKTPLFLGACVTTHPYTQKQRLKLGCQPVGFCLDAVPPDAAISTFRKDNAYTTEAFAGLVRRRDAKEVHVPAEMKPAAEMIYGNLALPRTIHIAPEAAPDSPTESTWAFRSHIRNGVISVSALGADCVERFNSDLLQLKGRGADMASLYFPLDAPGTELLYEAAKAEGFFFVGLFPATDYGDMLLMQKMFSHVVDYDSIITTGPFTELLDMVRSFDPDQKK